MQALPAWSRPTRSTARSGRRAPSPRHRRCSRSSPTRRRRPAPDLLALAYHAHLRAARDGHPLLEQLRPLPVPREADPAHDPERAARQAAAGLRRRRATSATGSTSRTTARRWCSRSRRARPGEVYNIGGGAERKNLEIVKRDPGAARQARVAHHVRQGPARATTAATRSTRRKIERELGWTPAHTSRRAWTRPCAGTSTTRAWWERVLSGAYRQYFETQYGARLRQSPRCACWSPAPTAWSAAGCARCCKAGTRWSALGRGRAGRRACGYVAATVTSRRATVRARARGRRARRGHPHRRR